MPGPGDTSKFPRGAEDALLDLLAETIEGLDRPVRAQFLQRLLRSIAQIDLTEAQSLDCWEQILERRAELANTTGKPVSLKAAIVDVLASSNFLRVPILMEYEELKKLQINAATDPLTGLYNRRLFEEYFEKELNRARRYSQTLALVILDLHQFKEVNDRYGHLLGDQVLRSTAGVFRQSLRTSDYAFRIGGDEFALLLPQTELEQAASLSRRVRSTFADVARPLKLEIPLGLDYGVSVFPQDGEQKELLIRAVDERLYQMKHANRGNQAAPVPVERAPAPKPEPPAPPPVSRAPQPTPPPPVEVPPPPPPPTPAPAPAKPVRPEAERRKWERVSLMTTRAHALLSEKPEKSARVLDLSYGGVALEVEPQEQLGSSFHAVLHVPILPPVRVSLRRVYVKSIEGGKARVGCSFVS